VRVRPGATAVVALIAALHGTPSPIPRRAARPQGGDCTLGPLYLTVATRKPRAQLPSPGRRAQRAAKARDWAKAIPLYQAIVVARGPGSAEPGSSRRCGRSPARTSAPPRHGATTPAPSRSGRAHPATAEAARLARWPIRSPTARARRSGDRRQEGVSARPRRVAAQQYGDALVYFHIGHALRAELPGFSASSAPTYDKLGAAPEKREFYRRLPRAAPARQQRRRRARRARARQGHPRHAAGLDSLPCTELWINPPAPDRQAARQGIIVAPGNYKGLCFQPKLEMALFAYATVEPAGPRPGVSLGNRREPLERPLGRNRAREPRGAG